MDKDIQSFSQMEKELIAKHHGKVGVFYKGKLVSLDKDFDIALNKAIKNRGKEFFVHHLYTVEEQSSGMLVVLTGKTHLIPA